MSPNGWEMLKVYINSMEMKSARACGDGNHALSIPLRLTRVVNDGELTRHFSLKNFEGYDSPAINTVDGVVNNLPYSNGEKKKANYVNFRDGKRLARRTSRRRCQGTVAFFLVLWSFTYRRHI